MRGGGADIGLFIVSRYLLDDSSLLEKLAGVAIKLLLNLIGAMMAFVVLQKIALAIPKWKNSKCFAIFARYSMPIYLIHQQIIYFVISLLNGILNPYIIASINFVVAISVSLLISFLLMKFKITRFLIGEK